MDYTRVNMDELFSKLGYLNVRNEAKNSLYALCLDLVRNYDNEVILSVFTEQSETSQPTGLPNDFVPYCIELSNITLKKLYEEAKKRLIIPDISRKYVLITTDKNGTHLFHSDNTEVIDIAGFAYFLGVKSDQLIKEN